MSSTSATDSSQPSAPQEKKGRNPVERVIVWGAILAGVAIAGIEATARFGYGSTLSRLTTALEEDGSHEHKPLSLQDAEKMIAGFPKKVGERQGKISSNVTYRWSGLLKNYGAIQITYDTEEKMVTGVVTEGAPEEEAIPPTTTEPSGPGVMPGGMAATPQAGSGGPGGGPGGPGGAEGEGGGRRFDPFQNDADGDGKLSREEAPERMRENFDEIDTNQDGFIDAAELEARRAARSQRPATE